MILDGLYFVSTAAQHVTMAGGAVSAKGLAYLDPGTGSLIIQIAIGAVAGGLVGAKLFWKRIAGFFTRLFGRVSRA